MEVTMSTTIDMSGIAGTSPSLEAQPASVLAKRRARAKALATLERAELLRALERAYARRLAPEAMQIGTGQLLNLVLELEFPAPRV
jgi:hypothetical protein